MKWIMKSSVLQDYLGVWMRLDARGNENGIDAQFSVKEEQISFPVHPDKGETDLPFLFAYPDKAVIMRMLECDSVEQLYSQLPDKVSGQYDI